MRAGYLNEKASMIVVETTQSTSGATKRQRRLLEVVHVQRLSKLERALLSGGKEEFTTSKIILRARRNSYTQEATHLLYEQQFYRIDSKVKNADNTYNITAIKVNE